MAAPNLMEIVESAADLLAGPKRDAALIDALRRCRKELEDAKYECEAARTRVSNAKDKFDALATMLAGVDTPTNSSSTLSATLVKNDGHGETTIGRRGRTPSPYNQPNQKIQKPSSPSSLELNDSGLDIPIPTPPIPTNPIHIPAPCAYYSIVPSEHVIIGTHRDNFYRKLVGIPASEIENYIPPPSQANLRSKSQLAEGIHIARHWDTGDDELNAAAFRSKHKTWYSKMKPMSREVGRRTGIHVRTLESTIHSSSSSLSPSHGYQDGETVLCRYNRDGTRSIVYIDVTQLFDAFYEIHYIEQNHVRGNIAVKSRVDDLYANVTDSQVKTFLDTCPVCLERRGRPMTEMGVVIV